MNRNRESVSNQISDLFFSFPFQLELDAVSVSFVGPHADASADSPESRTAEKLTIIDGEPLKKWLDQLEKRKGNQSTGDGNTEAAGGGGTIGPASDDVTMAS